MIPNNINEWEEVNMKDVQKAINDLISSKEKSNKEVFEIAQKELGNDFPNIVMAAFFTRTPSTLHYDFSRNTLGISSNISLSRGEVGQVFKEYLEKTGKDRNVETSKGVMAYFFLHFGEDILSHMLHEELSEEETKKQALFYKKAKAWANTHWSIELLKDDELLMTLLSPYQNK